MHMPSLLSTITTQLVHANNAWSARIDAGHNAAEQVATGNLHGGNVVIIRRSHLRRRGCCGCASGLAAATAHRQGTGLWRCYVLCPRRHLPYPLQLPNHLHHGWPRICLVLATPQRQRGKPLHAFCRVWAHPVINHREYHPWLIGCQHFSDYISSMRNWLHPGQ